MTQHDPENRHVSYQEMEQAHVVRGLRRKLHTARVDLLLAQRAVASYESLLSTALDRLLELRKDHSK